MALRRAMDRRPRRQPRDGGARPSGSGRAPPSTDITLAAAPAHPAHLATEAKAMRDTVYFLVFDGFADWQAALALCEVRRPGDWQVATVGFTRAPVRSMGGLAVQPELSLAELDFARAALTIVPGGHLWQRGEGASAVAALRQLHGAGSVVAGIDSGVL